MGKAWQRGLGSVGCLFEKACLLLDFVGREQPTTKSEDLRWQGHKTGDDSKLGPSEYDAFNAKSTRIFPFPHEFIHNNHSVLMLQV
jgi:hypothetical protein